jgi:hypothetical protein
MDPFISAENPSSSVLARLSSSRLFFAALFFLDLVVAPFFCFSLDVIHFYCKWATASNGLGPWRMYPECNLPPLVPYILTFLQDLRFCLHATGTGPVAILIIKLPSILALFLGCWAIKRYGRESLGIAGSQAAGVLFVLCPALWFNAVMWGQWDVLLTVAIVFIVLAVVADRPRLAGVGIGVALTIKLQAIVVLPVVITAIFFRLSAGGLFRSFVAAALTWFLIVTPMLLAGAGVPMIHAYSEAVDRYPDLSISAWNFWTLLQLRYSGPDSQIFFGLLSARSIGIYLFAGYSLFLVGLVALRPRSISAVILAAALANVGFYQLPTQIHERYGLPACGLLALLAPRGQWIWFALLNLTITMNQHDAMFYGLYPAARATVFVIINVLILICGTIDLVRRSIFPTASDSALIVNHGSR